MSYLITHHNLDINVGDCMGNTVAHLAASESDSDRLLHLETFGVDFNHQNNVGQPALLFAINGLTVGTTFKWLADKSSCNSILKVLSYVTEAKLHQYVRHLIKPLAVAYFKDKQFVCEDYLIRSVPSCVELYQQCVSELSSLNTFSIEHIRLSKVLFISHRNSLGRNENFLNLISQRKWYDIFPLYWEDLVNQFKKCVNFQRKVVGAINGICTLTGFDSQAHITIVQKICHSLTIDDMSSLTKIGNVQN
ncbi:hypothetical protein QAD02_012143 [Eretmocerus hayati]|uniref:Uncharacterized protein n=1 Tax=Eretmocerus hayati TaxID=131215 RepID=A0ACC2NYW6_9HYME|nr:hypothetical protein QAD02_012143 [Eretmocerus hayati]